MFNSVGRYGHESMMMHNVIWSLSVVIPDVRVLYYVYMALSRR